MVPIKFKGHNIVFGENQPEFHPLPAFLDSEGTAVTCWKLEEDEIEHLKNGGGLFIVVHTFNQPLQPIFPTIQNPVAFVPEGEVLKGDLNGVEI